MLKPLTLLLLVLLVAVLPACKKVDIQFGDQYLDNGYTQVVKIDTFAADLSTVYVDSFVTSARGVTLLGGYKDPLFGTISTQSYFQVAPPAYTDTYANTTFDSLILILKLNKIYYGDTSQPLHVNVHRLVEPIAPYIEGGSIYNTRQFAVGAQAIGSKDLVVNPHLTDTVFIRLSDNIGRELLQKLQNPADVDINNAAGFLEYFKGLRLSAGANSSLVFGCLDSLIMRLHYTRAGLYQEHAQVDFTLNDNTHHFNNIQTDRSGTVLKDIGPLKNELHSSATGNAAYIQYASGVMAKIRFPSLRDLLKLPNYAQILRANLVVRPLQASYSSLYYLPPALRLASTTQLNAIGSDLVSFGSDGSSAAQTGSLIVDYLYGASTAYQYDVTAYLKSVLAYGNIEENKNGLLLIPPSPALETDFSRTVIGNNSNKLGKIELQIFYAAIQ